MIKVGSYQAATRQAIDDDWRWITATAVPQIRGLLPKAAGRFWQQVGHDIVALLRPSLHVVVCEVTGEDPILLGWRAELDGELVYEFVSRGYRQHGIGRAMRAEAEKARAA